MYIKQGVLILRKPVCNSQSNSLRLVAYHEGPPHFSLLCVVECPQFSQYSVLKIGHFWTFLFSLNVSYLSLYRPFGAKLSLVGALIFFNFADSVNFYLKWTGDMMLTAVRAKSRLRDTITQT